MYHKVVSFIRAAFRIPEGLVPLHTAYFGEKELSFLGDVLDVSMLTTSSSQHAVLLESIVTRITKASYAFTVDTSLHAYLIALITAGVAPGDEIITQPILDEGTLHALMHLHIHPVFLDVDRDTLGLSPEALENFLKNYATYHKGFAYNKTTGRRLIACMPMHTFGIPFRADEIRDLCHNWGIKLLEATPDGLGSKRNDRSTGTFGQCGVITFGDLLPVLGAPGAVLVTNEAPIAAAISELVLRGRLPRPWDIVIDTPGDSFTMPNLNAAALCAILDESEDLLRNKRALAMEYAIFFSKTRLKFVTDPRNALANFWMNAVILQDKEARDEFLRYTRSQEVSTRALQILAHRRPLFMNCQHDDLHNALWLADRVVTIPSSYRPFASRTRGRAGTRRTGNNPI